MKKEEVLLDNLYKKLSRTYNDLTCVFYKLLENNITYNEKLNIRKETLIIFKDLYSYLTVDLNKVLVFIQRKNNTYKTLNAFALISSVLKVIATLLIFLDIKLSLLMYFVLLSVDLYIYSPKRQKEINIDYDKLITDLKKVNILITNCTRRLSLDFDLEKSEYDDKDFYNMELANEIIETYIIEDVIKPMNAEVKEWVIKILKIDLKTDNNDIKELLDLAKNKSNGDVKKLIKKI